MKITSQGRAHAVRYLTDTGGNPVIPNPDSPAPDDPVDVALDADAFVPIAPPTSTAFIQESSNNTANTQGNCQQVLPAAPTVGNTMVVGYSQRSWNGAQNGEAGAITPPAGWTYVGYGICGPANGGATGLWYRVVQFGDDGTFDVAKNASEPGGGWIAEFAMGDLLDSDVEGPTAGATSHTSPPLTATATDQVFIAAMAQSTSSLSLTGDGTASLIATDSVAGGANGPTWIGQYRIGGPGAEDMDASSGDAQSWSSVVALFDTVGSDLIWVPAPETVDGDDATFDESLLSEVVRLDIGSAQRLISSRLLVGYDTAGSTTVHLWASNDPDMAGAVDVTSEVFTATGGGTGDEVLFTIADTTPYRYWEFRGPVDPTKTYTVEMFAFHTSFDLSGYQLLSEKDQPLGYAGLEASGQVPDDEIADGGATTGDVPISNGDGTRTWGPPTGITDITDIPTAETDTSLRLAPDGAGGVEWAAGSGGGASFAYVGYNTIGGSHLTLGSFNVAQKVTLASAGCIISVGAYIKMNSLASTTIDVAVFADSSGPVGPPLGWSRAGGDSYGGIVHDNNTPAWLDIPLGTYLAAGDYWVFWGQVFQGGYYDIYYDGSGTDKELTPTDGISFMEAIWRQTVASAGHKYSLRALTLT